MLQFIVLGSSNAVPSLESENTHFAITRDAGLLLIDCPGNPMIHLAKAGLNPLQLDHLVLTHFHPDHVSGAPALLMQSWLLGRSKPLDIHGLAYTLDRFEKMMELYDWESWPGFFDVRFHRLPEIEMTQVMADEEIRLFASPVKHMIPTIGLRIESVRAGTILAYSCDTEPCDAVVHLGHSAHWLFHEATGAFSGHSSAFQAGQIATQANSEQLALVHYPSNGKRERLMLLEQAQQAFSGAVILASDFMRFDI